MMYILSRYDIFLNLISLACEIVLLWCLITYIIYVGFIYLNRQYIYTQSLMFIYVYSFLFIFFFYVNIGTISSDLFGGCFLVTPSDVVVRNIVITISMPLLYTSMCWFINHHSLVNLIEYSILMYILIIAMCLIVYCCDIISLFLCIELQSMVVYILICLRGSFDSVTIGIRYFMLGTIVSLIFLFTYTIIYYLTGISSFIDYMYVGSGRISTLLLIIAYILFLFKLYIYPFHFIGGDLYRYSPMYVLLFISSVLYYIYMYIFIKIHSYVCSELFIMYIIVSLTLIFSVLNILVQRDIRSFLGFGTSVHSSMMLYIMFMDIYINIYVCMFYALVYIICVIGILYIISNYFNITSSRALKSLPFSIYGYNNIFMRMRMVRLSRIEYISGWSGLFRHHKLISIILSILLWSMAGLPPFSGFFAKFCVLTMCFLGNSMGMFVLFLIISIISSLYYIKLIKEYYYLGKERIYISHLNDFDLLLIFFVLVVCMGGIFIPEVFIYILY